MPLSDLAKYSMTRFMRGLSVTAELVCYCVRSCLQRTLLSQLRTSDSVLSSNLLRKTDFLAHPTFNRFVLSFV